MAIVPPELKAVLIPAFIIAEPNQTVMAALQQLAHPSVTARVPTNEMTVCQPAAPEPEVAAATALEASSEQASQGASCILVQAAGQLVGILTNADIARLIQQDSCLNSVTLGAAMTSPVIALSLLDQPAGINTAVHLIRDHNLCHLPLLDRQGQVLGVITPSSLLQAWHSGHPEHQYASAQGVQSLGAIATPQAAPQPTRNDFANETYKDEVQRDQDQHDEQNQWLTSTALRDGEARWQFALESAGDGIWDWNPQTDQVFFSQQWKAMLGYEVHELRNRLSTWETRVHPKDKAICYTELEKHFNGEIPIYECEHRVRCKDGTYKWILARGKVMERSPEGLPLRMLGVHTDISDRKQAEIQLQNLIAGTAQTMGKDFFPALVRHLATALNVSYAVVTAKQNSTLTPLAFWANGILHPPYSYELQHTPCQKVFEEGKFYCESAVQQQFPKDQDLVDLEVESYLGIALRDAQGSEIGHLYVMNQQLIRTPQRAERILRAFAARAAAELERQRAQQSLEELNQKLGSIVAERTAVLQKQEQFLRTLLDTFPLSIFWKDRDSVYQGCNRHFLNEAGVDSVGEIIGKTDYDLPWEPAQAAIFRQDDRSVMESGQAKLGIVQAQTKFDGDQKWMETNKLPLADLSGQINGVLGISEDITRRRETEVAMRQQLAAIEAAVDGIAILEAGKYLYLNQAHLNLFGYSQAEELLGEPWQKLYSPEEVQRFEQEIFPRLEREGAWQGEAIATRPDGSTFPEGLSLTLTEQGQLIRVCRDISDRKQAEAELIQAKDNAEAATRAKGSFLARMSHEIRTPMNGVIGMLNLLQDTELSSEQHIQIGIAQSSAESLLTLISDILDFSKVDAEKLDIESLAFDLQASLGTFAKTMALGAQAKNLELILDLSQIQQRQVKGDLGRLRQILTNLVDNAIKFTEQGEVLIQGKLEPIDDELQFTGVVADTGIGIPEAKQDCIFEAFHQVDASTTQKHGGTGLGLAISQGLCRLMGGDIAVKSKPGQGSQFTFTVRLQPCSETSNNSQFPHPHSDHPPNSHSQDPTADALAAGPATLDTTGLTLEASKLAIVQPGKLNILVIDDNETHRQVLWRQLQQWGHKVTTAASGSQALALCHQQIANQIDSTHPPFDLALVDLKMPNMSGSELAQQLTSHDRFCTMPLFMMNTMNNRSNAQLFSELGLTSSLTKPIIPTELWQALQKIEAQTDANKSAETQNAPQATSTPSQRKPYWETANIPPWPTQTRLLIVEDNRINQIVFQGLLKRFKLENVELAFNGLEALKILTETPPSNPFTLVFMDCLMPEMDGYATTRAIRAGQAGEQNRSIPIIAMTANVVNDNEEQCLAAGMNAYLTKPINPEAMANLLEQWLRPQDSSEMGSA